MPQGIITQSPDSVQDDSPMADSAGFSVARHKGWASAKYGHASAKRSVRLRPARSNRDRICAISAGRETAADSPYPRNTISVIPPRTGTAAAYAACGRKEGGHAIRGLGAPAEALRPCRELRRIFCNAPFLRNGIGNGFPAMKARLGAAPRPPQDARSRVGCPP